MPFLASWLLLFAPDGNFREFGLFHKNSDGPAPVSLPGPYAGGWNFSVITHCTDVGRPFME
jgi:hypothetical protein